MLAKKSQGRRLSFILGFSAGVMLYMALSEILPEASAGLWRSLGRRGEALALLIFLAGLMLPACFACLPPSFSGAGARRSGLSLALALALHNAPEGFALFTVALADPLSGIAVAGAVILHNIPLGMALAAAVQLDGGSRGKALAYALITGLTGPLGAAAGGAMAWVFEHMLIESTTAVGIPLSFAAGVMLAVALDELLPSARERGGRRLVLAGAAAGMGCAALSLLILRGV